jgi:hypothetical protein
MRNSSRQQPDGFHLLRLTELCLQAPSSGNVFHNDFEVAERAILSVIQTTNSDSKGGFSLSTLVGYCSFAYSVLACFRIGRSGSAFFHSAKKVS